jgi:hypothetical protein
VWTGCMWLKRGTSSGGLVNMVTNFNKVNYHGN